MECPVTSRHIARKSANLARVSKTPTEERGKKEIMQQYTLEFMEEWWKQE
jgi:hypothetical protein